MAHIYDTKKRASAFCKSKNKHARKYEWVYQSRDKGGYYVYKRKKGTKTYATD